MVDVLEALEGRKLGREVREYDLVDMLGV